MALISRWTLDGNPNDLNGVNNGAISGTVTFLKQRILGSYSAFFSDGANYIDLNTFRFTGQTNFSVSVWFRTTYNNVVIFSDAYSGNYTVCRLVTGNNRIYYQIIKNGDGLFNKATNSTTYLDNKWHHIVICDANGTVNAYIDGVLENGISGNYNRSGLQFDRASIGADRSQNPVYYKGYLDDIRYFDHVLSSNEVSQLYLDRLPRWQTPISIWALDGDANDLYGANNGTAVGTLSYSTSIKVYGSQAFTNAGGANYINLGTFRMLSYTAFSLSLWVKYSGTGSRGIISQCTTTSDAGFWRFITGSITGELYLQVLNDAGGVLFNVGTTTNYNDNKWHHVVIIDNNGVISSYIDGKSGPISGSYTRPTLSSNNASLAGSISKTNIYYWNGSLDDVRFYDVALTAAEVKALYASYFTEKAANFMSTLV